MLYVSKMVPTSDKGRFYAFGRVFSGTVSTGQKVRIMGPNYQNGKKTDLFEKNIHRVMLMMGRTVEAVESVPCGNTVGLVGVDSYLNKTGTISSHQDAHNIRVMKYSVSPVVRVAIQPKDMANLPKLIQGMRLLSKSDPLVLCINNPETGENIIAGSGELHVELCINDLVNKYARVEITQSDPVVSYKETVRQVSVDAMSKSQNKHNRITCNSSCLGEALSLSIENGEIPLRHIKERSKVLVNQFGWEKSQTSRLWAFGPYEEGANLISDATSGCQFMSEIREHMVMGFEQVTQSGVLCGENLRGVRFNVKDTHLHSDSIHRGGGQISPTTRRVLYASQLLAQPSLQEPIFLVEITTKNDLVNTIYKCIALRRGKVHEEVLIEGSPLTIMKVYLPVAESFGFTSFLRKKTAGKAFPTMAFHHYEVLEGDIGDTGTRLGKVLERTRVRKGLNPDAPKAVDYMDKL